MAVAADAQIVLELYRLRQEETLRAARKFIAWDFWPKDLEELRAVTRAMGTDKNASWRQAISYWEMAASLVLHGAVDSELFLESNLEGVFLYAKYHHWHAETEKESGNLFMKNTAALIERFPAAKAVYDSRLKSLQASR
ncbi:MAG: hypothetical protein JWM43_571 [Acidobacteriaceae bacterium]|nr:hypothetical protein [Acidobacteriaceae bacterium]